MRSTNTAPQHDYVFRERFMSRRRLFILLAALVLVAGALGLTHRRPTELVLTGIVTTNDVIVSPQMGGRVSRLTVAEGDSVRAQQLIAVLEPDELQADRAFYARSAEAMASQVEVSKAELAESEAQDSEAQASLANAKRVLDRNQAMLESGGVSREDVDAARTAYLVAQARAAAAQGEVATKRNAWIASRRQRAAASAQTDKAAVRLGYSEVPAPISGIVDVRAVRVGEVVTAGQPLVTLINPDSLWIRADVEETYIDRVRLGDRLTVRLPSGDERVGTVYYRGVDADFATQRDVSRTKRDIKTFEIRLRVDNRDRRLAVGMTAYVQLPVARS
jgi:HlyD family secretion protein